MELKTHDINNRRLPYVRVSTGKRITPQDRDIEIFECLQTHGILSSRYLYDLTKHIAKDETGLKKRLGDLFHEANTAHGGPYLDRWGDGLRAETSFYQLTDRAIQVLKDYDLRQPVVHDGWWKHQAMTAAITASIDLACREKGFTFIRQDQIAAELRVKTDHGPLVPDALFGIRYGDGARYFALEADRASEDMDTIEGKVLKYRDLIGNTHFKKAYNIPNLICLIITTNSGRVKNILKRIEQNCKGSEGPGSNYILVSHIPYFYNIPKYADPRLKRSALDVPVMDDLMTRPYQRAGRSDFFIDNPARQ